MGVSWHQFLPWEITDLKNKLFYVLGFLSSARRSPSLCSFLRVWFIQTSGSDWFENPWFWLFQRWPFIIFILLPHCIQDLFDVCYAYFNVELYVFSFAWQNLLSMHTQFVWKQCPCLKVCMVHHVNIISLLFFSGCHHTLVATLSYNSDFISLVKRLKTPEVFISQLKKFNWYG